MDATPPPRSPPLPSHDLYDNMDMERSLSPLTPLSTIRISPIDLPDSLPESETHPDHLMEDPEDTQSISRGGNQEGKYLSVMLVFKLSSFASPYISRRLPQIADLSIYRSCADCSPEHFLYLHTSYHRGLQTLGRH